MAALPGAGRSGPRVPLRRRLHPPFGVATRVLSLARVRPGAVQPGLLEHHPGTPVRVDHEPGAARPPLPPGRPFLTGLPAPYAVLLRLPAPGDAGRDPDAGAGARRLADLSARQAEAARWVRGMVGADLLPVRATRLHQPVRLSRGRPFGSPPRIRPVLP